MAQSGHIRIGIDVGGTFTHAVAVDARRAQIIGKCKMPTTHAAAEGVARGVAESLLGLLDSARIAPDDIAMIAHSTTQATNALLEGDVAAVGIVGTGDGLGAALAKVQTRIAPIQLTPTRNWRTFHRFLRTSKVNDSSADRAVAALRQQGAQAIVAAAAFSVDDPRAELTICRAAQRLGIPTTATHWISQLHGLGLRTRTAIINASMIPKMLATANMTEQAVRDAGIQAPVMIMRSDGGIMSIAEMRRRPILTMLSGPAAGVAAALLYARVSDGIFLEVGGTSTDISAIKNGRTQISNATVGGNRLHVHTLDVRTIGVAGGSLVGVRAGSVANVGPRSAHIAGLPYLSFASAAASGLSASTWEHEGESYLTVRAGDLQLAITPTCASNYLGLVPEDDTARGNHEVIRAGIDCAAGAVGAASGAQLARSILDHTAQKAAAVIEGLIADYKLERGVLRLVAGGGGGSAIVPFLAEQMNLPFVRVENADVISAIGVALALVRDVIERTVVNPTPDDVRRIREEVVRRVLQMGASAETVEVFVEVDAKRNLLRATAEGALEIRERAPAGVCLDEAQRRELLRASLRQSPDAAELLAQTRGLEVWGARRTVPRFWKYWRQDRLAVRVLDVGGTIRWASNHAAIKSSTTHRAQRDLADFAEEFTRYTDAGATIPHCFVALADRIVDLSGLADVAQVNSVLAEELPREAPDDPCVLLLNLSRTE